MFFRETYSVARTDLPTIDLAQTLSVFSVGPETDARGHWYFGADRGLDDLLGGQLLTAQGAAPTLAAGYATLNGAAGNALLTPYDDSAVQTVCAVVRVPNPVTASMMIAGTITTVGTDGGSGLYLNGGTLSGNVRFTGGNSSAVQASRQAGATAGAWIFVAYSEQVDAAPGARAILIGGGGSQTDAPAGVKRIPAPTKKLALGNGYYTDWTQNLDVAEFIVFAGPKTLTELGQIYNRSAIRCGERGIGVI